MDPRERLDFVTHHTRAAMLQHSTLETCILTTKMLCHLIPDLLGMQVMPLGVGVIGANAAARAAIEGGAIVTTNKEHGEVVLMCSHRGDDASKPGTQWWGGHLILVADNRYLVDGSADQFNTPEVGFCTKPFVADLGDEDFAYDWMMGDQMIGFELDDHACIAYEPHLEDFSYRPSMDWDETQPGDKLYDFVAERVGGLLEAYGDYDLTPAMLPALPPTLSRKYGSTDAEIAKRELASAWKLGYTKKELIERSTREDEREVARQSTATARGIGIHWDAAKAMEAAEAETRKAMEKMEPRLRAAIELAGTQHWYSQADSPLASSPPSSP